MGHLRSYCPKTPAETRKWHPLCLGAVKAGGNVGQSQCGGEVPGDIESLATDSLGSTEPESVARCWEVEATEPHSKSGPTSVKGRLKSCLQFWESERYHHVDIADHHCKYIVLGVCLGWAFLHCMCSQYYPLAWPLLVTYLPSHTVLRPLVRYWRARGLRILVYLDDGLCAVAGKKRGPDGEPVCA